MGRSYQAVAGMGTELHLKQETELFCISFWAQLLLDQEVELKISLGEINNLRIKAMDWTLISLANLVFAWRWLLTTACYDAESA